MSIEINAYTDSRGRVYYAKTGRNAYLLLCGGDKSSQKNDVELAKQYLRIFKKREVFFV